MCANVRLAVLTSTLVSRQAESTRPSPHLLSSDLLFLSNLFVLSGTSLDRRPRCRPRGTMSTLSPLLVSCPFFLHWLTLNAGLPTAPRGTNCCICGP
ncbi:hypothetical protein LZ31DRAFT_271094 [Colletotrichum somersetense]|nr:hypothetical protein LZ31DRAFT_271094 [Colletotrichum somersetense]